MPVDLHLHTTNSDGSLTPTEVVENANRLGLTTIAIADHDTTGGVDEAIAVGANLGVEVIPAVELSSKYNSRDIHILGYFIFHHNQTLQDYLRTLKNARTERAAKIVECLRSLGVDITFEEVQEEAAGASVGRPHIARVLLKKNYITSFTEAFEQYLKRGTPCFIEKFVYPPDKLISLIHEAGGVAVFAHPGLSGLDDLIPALVKMGLDGFEAYHIDHTPEMTARYIKFAHEYGLIVTGGSDCHGPISRHGLRLGTVPIPDEVVDKLKSRVQLYRENL